MDPALHPLSDERTCKIWLAGMYDCSLDGYRPTLIKTPPSVTETLVALFVRYLFLELSSARMNAASPPTIDMWKDGIEAVKELLVVVVLFGLVDIPVQQLDPVWDGDMGWGVVRGR